ncbi:MAG: hypothetical protein FWD80_06350, partial [Propionibacteriaceae bacterium]|nr:hypothetical protein [Propionibacteriaceae bacterium]
MSGRGVFIRRGLVGVAVTGLILAAMPSMFATAAPPQGTPGAPGVAQNPTVVWAEPFEELDGKAATPLPLDVHLATPTGPSPYSADNAWMPIAQACNGWVLNATDVTAPNDVGCKSPGGVNAQGTGMQAWWFLDRMATALGLAQGQTPAAALDNVVVSSETNGGTQTAGVQFVAPNEITATAGHYYTVSIYLAATHCAPAPAGRGTWYDPSETLYLIVNGQPVKLTEGFNPCTAANHQSFTVKDPNGPNSVVVRTAQFQSAPLLVPTNASLGIELYNATAQAAGNDVAFDLPQITDVTPQLDKSFAPTTIGVDQVSTLTFTVTNTYSVPPNPADPFTTGPSNLAEKAGWSFTDHLPDGVVIADPSNASTTCKGGTVAASPGGTTVGITNGDLAAGATSCNITVNVSSHDAVPADNPHVNNAVNVTMMGLNAPGPATLTVVNDPQLTLTKSVVRQSGASMDEPLAADESLIYSYVVTNAGHVTITDLAINDPEYATADGTAPGFSGTGGWPEPVTCPTTTLLPGAQIVCNVGYTVTDADELAGILVNAATATGKDPYGDAVESALSSVKLPGNPTASLEVTKSNDPLPDMPEAGDPVHFLFAVTNTGNVPLRDVAVVDQMPTLPVGTVITLPVTCPISPLLPGQTTTCTATYTLRQGDIDDGEVHNPPVTASGTAPDKTTVSGDSNDVMIDIPQVPSLSLVKSASPLDEADFVAGTQITYQFVVQNTGNVALSNLAVDDGTAGSYTDAVHSGFSGTGPLGPITCSPVAIGGTLPAETSTTCTAEYTLTAEDVDASEVDNTAFATGQWAGQTMMSNPSTVTLPGEEMPKLSLVKTAVLSSDETEIAYSLTVTNTGNILLTNVAVA